MPKRRSLRPGTRGEEVIGAAIGALVGYIAAEGILAPLMHPLHWLTAIIVAVIAYFGVLFWYRWQYPRRPSTAPSGQKHSVRRPWYRRWRPGGHS